MDQDITQAQLASFSEDLAAWGPYVVARNAATSAGVRAAMRSPLPYRLYHDTYSVSLSPTGEVTNQRKSGRCWAFAALNVLRDRMMSELGTTNFELSQAYIQFFDKLEKANLFLEEVIRTADLPLDDRVLQMRLEAPVPDGGWWDMAVALIEKYGVVPKQCMPDTANACATSDMNDMLFRKMRRDAIELREAIAAGVTTQEVGAKKQAMLSEVYRMLCVALGEPPATFDFEYVADARPEAGATGEDGGKGACADKDASPEALAARKAAHACDGRFVRLSGLTPKGFLERYAHVNLHDYVSLGNIPGESRPYGSILQLQHWGSVAGVPIRILNEPIEVLKAGVIEQLKAGHPAWFACDVLKNMDRDDATGLLDTQTFDPQSLFGVDFEIEKAQAFDTCEVSLNHAMTFQGVNLADDGSPSAWRVENSWGKEHCHDGYFIMTDRFFNAYVGQVIVHRDYLPAEIVKAWDSADTPVIETNPWSPMFGMSD